jgi:hypothetical protein
MLTPINVNLTLKVHPHHALIFREDEVLVDKAIARVQAQAPAVFRDRALDLAWMLPFEPFITIHPDEPRTYVVTAPMTIHSTRTAQLWGNYRNAVKAMVEVLTGEVYNEALVLEATAQIAHEEEREGMAS